MKSKEFTVNWSVDCASNVEAKTAEEAVEIVINMTKGISKEMEKMRIEAIRDENGDFVAKNLVGPIFKGIDNDGFEKKPVEVQLANAFATGWNTGYNYLRKKQIGHKSNTSTE